MDKVINQMIAKIENATRPIKIGFPDGNDARILEATLLLKKLKNVEPVIIDEALIAKYDKSVLIECFKKIRQAKNTIEEFEQWAKIPNYVAMALLEMGQIDCVVGGATTPTADLLRPALQIVGAKTKTITSFFWMNKGAENYFLGDAAIVPNPTSLELVEMTKLINQGVQDIFEINPFIAMLSFSTSGSGGDKNDSVNKVREASHILKAAQYNVLGETQFDAAFDYETRQYKWKKAIESRPNVYIFPNLDAANIGYKIMKLTGNYEAIGPIIVGLKKPVNDLSRGSNALEVYNLSLITINMYLKEQTNG